MSVKSPSRLLFLITATTTAAAALSCGTDAEEGAGSAEENVTQAFSQGCPTWGGRGDGDSIDDGHEQCLLDRYAPVNYLPLSMDWTLPANVDWFLARSTLRFHHNNCPDCSIVGKGPSQWSLGVQNHQHRGGWLCRHSGGSYPSGSGDMVSGQQYFLQMLDDASHGGSGNPADWRVYGHVYRNVIGGADVQYWFFYPYNDNFGGINHEGDWESITVRLRGDGSTESVFYCDHGNCKRKETWQVRWHGGTHPYVWVADGSHASYANESDCDWAVIREGGIDSCESNDHYRWFTWAGGKGSNAGFQGGGVLNVGEKGSPINGQSFLLYNGRWGEIGSSDVTSGPTGPAYKDKWELDLYGN